MNYWPFQISVKSHCDLGCIPDDFGQIDGCPASVGRFHMKPNPVGLNQKSG